MSYRIEPDEMPAESELSTLLESDRLLLRRPTAADAQAIFGGYASDPEVTRYVGWPRHRSLEDTREFLAFSDDQWRRWPCGPLAVLRRSDGLLIGSSGLAFESAHSASTGYVLRRDCWGRGYATEALRAVLETAPDLGLRTVYALCHPDHRASRHVLEKAGFRRQSGPDEGIEFPNLEPGVRSPVLRYVLEIAPTGRR